MCPWLLRPRSLMPRLSSSSRSMWRGWPMRGSNCSLQVLDAWCWDSAFPIHCPYHFWVGRVPSHSFPVLRWPFPRCSGGWAGPSKIWQIHRILFQPSLGFVATNCEELQQQWQPAVNHIEQSALSLVFYTLVERPILFRHRCGVWSLDNVAAVMPLVRAHSGNLTLQSLIILIRHLLC